MDFIDILKPKTDMFCKGTYYEEKPLTTYEKETTFDLYDNIKREWGFNADTKPLQVNLTIEKIVDGVIRREDIVVDDIKQYENGTYYVVLRGVIEVIKGTYTAQITSITQLKGGKWFDYDITDERFRQYSTIENLQIDNKTLTIVTRDRLGFKPKKHIVTQDGDLWQILAVRETTDNKQPLRFLKSSSDTKFIISLVALDNVWEIQ
ncbi:MAG: hypothetical protein KBS91_02575 [Firmicutes bacterium]|nr:hypothetical protein [Candidatus Caballimonas caccae]